MILYPLTEEDVAETAALERRLFSDPWTPENIRGGMDPRTGYCLAARDASGLAGYLIACIVGDEGELLRIGTAPERRGRGLGSELLERMLEENPGVRIWRLDVRAGNAPAIRLYEKAGFHTVTENRDFYRDPRENGLLMARELC